MRYSGLGDPEKLGEMGSKDPGTAGSETFASIGITLNTCGMAMGTKDKNGAVGVFVFTPQLIRKKLNTQNCFFIETISTCRKLDLNPIFYEVSSLEIRKKILFGTMIALLAVVSYLLISSFFGESKKKKSLKANQLGFLFGGGGKSGNSMNKFGVRGEDSQSLFDGAFIESGKFSSEEPETVANGPKGEAPINPQTGKPYNEEAMEQFDRLREIFPENSIIPRRITPEEKEKRKQEDERLAKATNAVFGGKPAKADVETYYGNMEKQAKDRLEIINYLVDNYGGEDPEIDKQYKSLQDTIKAQNEQIERERKEALAKF